MATTALALLPTLAHASTGTGRLYVCRGRFLAQATQKTSSSRVTVHPACRAINLATFLSDSRKTKYSSQVSHLASYSLKGVSGKSDRFLDDFNGAGLTTLSRSDDRDDIRAQEYMAIAGTERSFYFSSENDIR